ncbi:MAG: hypothetical protein LBQ77_06165 [Treponema sp.]|jgi:hypothetical protein|nr:hypothetical protein [Treponema sp.]
MNKKSLYFGLVILVVAMSVMFTACKDDKAPVLSGVSAKVSSSVATTVTVKFKSNEKGTYYCALSKTALDKAAIKAATTLKSTGEVEKDKEKSFDITNVTEPTTYKAYLIVEDEEGNVSDIATANVAAAGA